MTAPTFFASCWLSADIILIETIDRDGACGRRETPFVRHERSSIRSHAFSKTGVICTRDRIALLQAPLCTPPGGKSRLVHEKMSQVSRLGFLICEGYTRRAC